MMLIYRYLRFFCVAVVLFSNQVLAALPDPVAFSWAIENGDVKKVKQWLEEGLDPEFQGSHIGTGLMLGAWYGNIEIMQLFLERGANPRRSNKNGEQPVQLAAWHGHTEAVKWLLSHGAPLNREGHAWNALHYAVFNGHTELAQYLLEQGASINARSPNGSTALMLAAREGREDAAKLLIGSGADTTPKNDWGDTALTMAMRYDHYRLGKMISSPEEFEIAVKAPKENFGEQNRSVQAPDAIEVLLAKIREAEARGESAESIRESLLKEVHTFRRNAMARKNSRQATMPVPYQPKSIVITAKRNAPGAERAQVVPRGKAGTAKPTVAAKPQQATPQQRAKQAQIADLLRQIRLADAQGQPVDHLHQRLDELTKALE